MSPVDYRRYPDNWHDEIRPSILERAGHQCEWCNAPNHEWIYRHLDNPEFYLWIDANGDQREGKTNTLVRVSETADFSPDPVRVVLTIAHLGTDHADGTPGDKHDKLDCRPENLAALCQRCHLLYDIDEHIENRRKTLLRKKLEQIKETGQLMLFSLIEHDDE